MPTEPGGQIRLIERQGKLRAPRGLNWMTPLLAPLYGLGVMLHRSFAHARFAPIATLCVGNITAGGTGKTPAAIYIALELNRRGRKPAILMRGYKAQGSDEAAEAAAALKSVNVPVLLGPDRYVNACEAAKRGCDVALLDDGFQHWRLKRDLDIVLIDATCPFGGGKLLPHGLLREPLNGLGRAGVIIISHSQWAANEQLAAIETELRRHAPAVPILRARHTAVAVRALNDTTEWTLPRLRGLRALVACGIGSPAAFSGTVNEAGVEIVGDKVFPDHHAYDANDVAQLGVLARTKNAAAILVTEKDAVKLRSMALPSGVPFLSLGVEFQIDNAAPLWEKIDRALSVGDKRAATGA